MSNYKNIALLKHNLTHPFLNFIYYAKKYLYLHFLLDSELYFLKLNITFIIYLVYIGYTEH